MLEGGDSLKENMCRLKPFSFFIVNYFSRLMYYSIGLFLRRNKATQTFQGCLILLRWILMPLQTFSLQSFGRPLFEDLIR